MKKALLFPALILGSLGCASQPNRDPEAPYTGSAPERVQVARTVVTPDDAHSIPELYEQARAQYRAGEFEAAARAFDRIYALDPNGELAAEALLGAGTAWDDAGKLELSVQRLEQLVRRFPKHATVREALLRSIRVNAYLERWQRTGELSDRLLKLSELQHSELIVAHGGKALSLVARGDVDRADYHITKARNVIEEFRLDAAGRVSPDLAQVYFALGEVRRIRAERITFNPVPENFPARLEERCQMLLDAQSAYSDTMRAYNAHWSAMAGYRVGELYQNLHEDIMRIPSPKGADNEARQQLFEGAMRLRYSILLDKAKTMMEHTLSMSKRAGEKSNWVARAEQADADIQRAIKAEKEALDKLPYTREQLQQALDDLANKKKSTTSN